VAQAGAHAVSTGGTPALLISRAGIRGRLTEDSARRASESCASPLRLRMMRGGFT
jgi:hypothetical protein